MDYSDEKKCVITRFPPENSLNSLHLGHLKAMMYDFELNTGCKCILRMDDTNPETEKMEYVDGIIKDVEWLGFTPWKLTYTSDYFDKLIEFAFILISNGKAYVDFTPIDKMKEMRHTGEESGYRNYPIDWHITEFTNMINRKYESGFAVLRLKIDMKNSNHTLRDPVAYRINYFPHYRTGTKYVIYPSYDYSHGIVDALENITFSYCTTEFYIRREQYYWPVKELGLKPAEVREFGRLNVEGNVLSKRKIKKLIEETKVSNFDDPRLLTIEGLKRRGFTPKILRNIISTVTNFESDKFNTNDTNISQHFIDHCLREELDKIAPRMFAVIDPLKINIINFDGDMKDCEHPNHSNNPEMGIHNTIITKNIYIEKSDFKNTDSKDYYRLTHEKPVRLRYSDFIKYNKENDDGSLDVELIVPENPKKIKGVIHWISFEDSIEAKFELYNHPLFFEKDSELFFNDKSKEVYYGRVENSVMKNLEISYQFERLGYFKFDRFEDDKPVFIRIVDLFNKYK